MLRRLILASGGAALLLSACATAPRGPAARLAAAGSEATTAFSADINRYASQMIMAGAQDAYTAMWQACQSAAGCPDELPVDGRAAQRLRLAAAIQQRGRALDQLGKAYQALAKEADYDGAADLRGATGEAIAGVNGFTAAVAAAGGPAVPAISATIGIVASGISGVIGDQRQRGRLLEGSRRISAAVTGLRDGLRSEAVVFESLAQYLGGIRTGLRIALLEGGLISRADALRPLTQSIDAAPVANAESLLGSSPSAQRALLEAVRMTSEMEVHQVRARYASAIRALDALVLSHRQFEADDTVGLADVDRLVSQFTALLNDGEDAE